MVHAHRLVPPVLGCLTLGLAPFVPEPHVAGKLRWVLGGARGMGAMDWFDMALHGAPWLWLLATLATWSAASNGGAPPGRHIRWALFGAVFSGLACVVWSLRP